MTDKILSTFLYTYRGYCSKLWFPHQEDRQGRPTTGHSAASGAQTKNPLIGNDWAGLSICLGIEACCGAASGLSGSGRKVIEVDIHAEAHAFRSKARWQSGGVYLDVCV